MKMKTASNTLVIGSLLLLLYLFVGHGFVHFYLGGKAELLETAAEIKAQCDGGGACPATLPGWQPWGDNRALAKGEMLYFAVEDESGRRSSFRLVYRFFMPDDWFEAEGGVDKSVSSGWKSRPEG